LNNGTIIVAAMGNNRQGGSPIEFPGAIPGVIAVGATSLDDTVAKFSTRGNHISLCAPGVAIWSTLPTHPGQSGFDAIPGLFGQCIQGKPHRRETDYDAWDGTSMASPHVAAAVALLLANQGKMTPADARDRLMATAHNVPAMHGADVDSDYGAGRLDLLGLLSS
jgi:subtilisin family serine protease